MTFCFGRQNGDDSDIEKVRGYSYPDFRMNNRTLCPITPAPSDRGGRAEGTTLQSESGADCIAYEGGVGSTTPATMQVVRQAYSQSSDCKLSGSITRILVRVNKII